MPLQFSFVRYIHTHAPMGGSFSIDSNADKDEITARLQVRQTVITVLVCVHFLGALYLLCQTLVTGYAIVTTPPGTTAVPHAIWLLAPFVMSFLVAMTTRFEVGLYLDTLYTGLYYAYFVIAVSMVANAIALGLFAWELRQGVSNFYVQAYGFLIATVIVTAIFIVLELVLIGAVYLFHRDLKSAINASWVPSYKAVSPFYQTDGADDQETDSKYGGNKYGTVQFPVETSYLRRTRLVKHK